MKRVLLLTAALAFVPVMAARADVIPTNTAVSSGTGPYTWSYSADVGQGTVANSGIASASGGMNSGAFFTLYDIAGFVTGSCISPTGWGCSTQNTGLTPAGTLPTDNPNLINVTWAYLAGAQLAGGTSISGFSFMSDSNVAGMSNFTSSSSRASGQLAGTTVADIGMVTTPSGGTTGSTNNGGGGTPTPPPTTGGTGGSSVPEPATLSLLGLALAGLGFTRRRSARGIA